MFTCINISYQVYCTGQGGSKTTAQKSSYPKCSEIDRQILEQWAHSRTEEARLVERAKIILKCLQGEMVHSIARELKVRPNTVIEWRRRFDKQGLNGLKTGLALGNRCNTRRSFAIRS